MAQQTVLKRFCPAPNSDPGYYPMMLKLSFAFIFALLLLFLWIIKKFAEYLRAITVDNAARQTNATLETRLVDEYERGLLHGATDAIDQAKEDLEEFRGTATREEIAGVLDRALRASLMERRQGGWGV